MKAPLELDLSGYPEVLKRSHLAKLMGCSISSIEAQLARGTFPIPRLALSKTPRWSKARVKQFLLTETSAPTRRSA